MKSAFALLAAILVSSSAFASSFSLQLANVRQNEITLRFSTIQVFSSMCFFNSKIEAVHPAAGNQLGQIEIEAKNNPMGICMMAFGPHSGSVSFKKDQLPAGKYNVIINHESQGLIDIQQ